MSSYYQKLGQLKYVSIVVLSGCATSFHPYSEPDPTRESTARLRTTVIPGVSARVFLHQNNNSNMCLIENEAAVIPVHTNVSGFPGESKKKIGMPFSDSYWEKIGAEVYIPAKDDLTFSASFSAAGAHTRTICRMAFRFRPIPDKNYQLLVQAGQQKNGHGACIVELNEIVEDLTSKKIIQRNIERTPVSVKGSPAWDAFCKNSGS